MKNRTDYISELNSFLSSSKSRILRICEDLGWNNDNEAITQEQEEIVVCPLDNGHRMPEKSLSSHIEKCQLHKQGYSDSSLMFPPSYEAGPNTVKIDEDTLNAILQSSSVNAHGDKAKKGIKRIPIPDSPRRKSFVASLAARAYETAPTRRTMPLSCDRLMTDFTREERLALYDYVVKNTKHCSETDVKEINITSQDVQDAKPMTLEELAAADRDARRRRVRYKSKKVHTSRKSRTEVLRGVIQSQMEGYVEWIKQQKGDSMHEDDGPARPEGLDCSSNSVQQTTSSIKEIRHSWEQWDYFGLNPHRRYVNVLKEEADKKRKEGSRKSPEMHKSRTKDSYSSRHHEDRERSRREYSSGDYKKYRNDDSHSRNKYHIDCERNEAKSKEYRTRDHYNRFESPRIKSEPQSPSHDSQKVDHASDRKHLKYHTSSKCYKSDKYGHDPESHINYRKHVEKRRHSTSLKNSAINSHSESDKESNNKSRSREHRHKSRKNKKKKHSSRKKKRKRHSSSESSETEYSKFTDRNDSNSE